MPSGSSSCDLDDSESDSEENVAGKCNKIGFHHEISVIKYDSIMKIIIIK